MANLAVGDVTTTINSKRIEARKKIIDVSLAFGDAALTYPAGGVPMPVMATYGLVRSLDFLRIYDEAYGNGYSYKYDPTNNKMLVYQGAAIAAETSTFTGVASKPNYVSEELQVIATHVGTLTYVPFYITAIHVTAGGTTGAFNIIPVGETPATTECAVNLLTGGMTFYATDAVTEVKVSYVPLQLAGPFVEANRVVDEAVVAAAAKTDLAFQAAAIQYVYDDTDSALCTFEQVGAAPSATHIVVVDIDDGSDDTNIDSHADDEGNSNKVTYILYSALKAAEAIGDGDLTLTSEAYDFNGTANYRALVLPGLGTQWTGEEAGTTGHNGSWEGPSGTAGAALATLDPYRNYILTNDGTAVTILSMPWFILDENLVVDETPAGANSAIGAESAGVMTEVTGVALAAAVIKAEVVGW